MTVTTELDEARFIGNGVTDTFPFDEKRVFSASDFSVKIVTWPEGVLVEELATAEFTVTIIDDESASVQVVPSKVPSSAQAIIIRRVLDKTQDLSLPTGTNFPAVSVENALDRQVCILQNLSADLDRAIKLPSESFLSGITLPTPVSSTVIGWNSTATNLTTYDFSVFGGDLDVVVSGLANGDYLQYNGTQWVNVPKSDLPVDGAKATSSAGLAVKNSAGTRVALFGAGPGTGVTFDGGVNITGTLTTTGNATFNGNATATKQVIASGVISPSNLASNTNDWNPTDLANASCIRLNQTTANISLTGLQGGAEGRIITLHNIGTATLTLVNDATSTAANRFLLGRDFYLSANSSVTFRYDATTSRWRLIGGQVFGINMSAATTATGTSVDFTGLPAGIRRIFVSIVGMSTNGTAIPIMQLGTSSGPETSGYAGAKANHAGAGTTTTNLQASGFDIGLQAAANVYRGELVLCLSNASTNTWTCIGSFGLSNSTNLVCTGGDKALAATLDRLRFTTVGGVDTYDAGTITVKWEF